MITLLGLARREEKKLQDQVAAAERLLVALANEAHRLSTMAMEARTHLEQIRNQLYFTRKKEIDELIS